MLTCVVLQIFSIALYSQRSSTLTFSYFNSYVSNDQVEMRASFYPQSFAVGLDLGIGTNFDEDLMLKAGLIYDFYRSDRLSLDIGVRAVIERFYYNNINAVQITWNLDFPIRMNFDLLSSYYITGSIITTYNTYYDIERKAALSFSFGLGYYFW